jgi:hypothetical protein
MPGSLSHSWYGHDASLEMDATSLAVSFFAMRNLILEVRSVEIFNLNYTKKLTSLIRSIISSNGPPELTP